jgi:hypothetical protein
MQCAGIVEPDIILPAKHIDLFKWAVVACDQFTLDGLYWDEVARVAGGSPSTLNLIFPEIFLNNSGDNNPDDNRSRIKAIHETMRGYLVNGVLAPPKKGFIYVERETTGGLRPGLIAAVDLEQYDWKTGIESPPLIRATEGTIEDRLPPRVEIRKGAPLELPHIMLLVNDNEDGFFKTLASGTGAFDYDTELMQNGGHVRGRFVKDPGIVWDGLERLLRLSGGDAPFLFAVGDGNHSLATAKAVWEAEKPRHGNAVDESPLRYALTEIVNLHCPALSFEPIHRALLMPEGSTAPFPDLAPLTRRYKTRSVENRAALEAQVKKHSGFARFGIIHNDTYLLAETDSPLLTTAALEPALTAFCASHPALTLDYIHGEDALFDLCAPRNGEQGGKEAAGFLLPPFDKNGLFETVAKTGPLPRKSFSMGEARDKRYYMEARRLSE